MGSQVWSLLSLGIGLNLVLGAMVAAFKLPVYLDSLGTVLVAALAGPGAAALAGGGGVLLLGLTSPTALAFLPVGVTVGLLAGASAKLGAFRKSWSAVLAGACVGVVGAAVSAPIAAVMFGGVTGGGTDLLVALFRFGGLGTLQAAFGQALAVDPIDKGATFLLVYSLLRVLPSRALSPFPLAQQHLHKRGHRKAYRPQSQLVTDRATGRFAASLDPIVEKAVGFPPASTGPKLLTVLSLLCAAGFAPAPSSLTKLSLLIWLLYFLAAPALTLRLTRSLFSVLIPLSVSLVVIHGLLAHREGEIRWAWLGLGWSTEGLNEAWFFSIRVALMLFALSLFFSTTSTQRLVELLLRWRCPYPLAFVLLTGANLSSRLKERWSVVVQAQVSRGLNLHPTGLREKMKVLLAIITPTLGAVLSEIPARAANLESRGFLTARPQGEIPLAWTGEAPPTLWGQTYQFFLTAICWMFVIWAFV